MRDFGLEVFFSKWEFSAKHHMTASDLESISVADLLALSADTDSLDDLWLGYTETWGAPDLREAIAGTYDDIKPEDILCLAGAGEGLYMIARVLLDSNDHVIVPTPNYQSAETVPLSVCAVSGVPMRYDASARGGWVLSIDDIKAAIKPNTKLISLNFPHNPTGMLIPRNDLDQLIEICREKGIYILIDEVYRGVEIDPADQMPQIADVYERGISLNVLSKAYGLPGLRIGWMATQDSDILLKLERYKHYLSICNSAPSERLAVIALQAQKKLFARNHGLVIENLKLLESLFDDYSSLFEWTRPLGGCVAFPKYKGPDGVEVFCRSLVEDSGVLLLPSSIYYSEIADTPNDHFRIGFGRDAVFKDGINAMREHLDQHYAPHRS